MQSSDRHWHGFRSVLFCYIPAGPTRPGREVGRKQINHGHHTIELDVRSTESWRMKKENSQQPPALPRAMS